MKQRSERLVVEVERKMLEAIEEFRFRKRLASRSAAIRELLKRGMQAQGQTEAEGKRN
jgi:metal-responsive CopG/Arc/MetJ family transcriptional regulator